MFHNRSIVISAERSYFFLAQLVAYLIVFYASMTFNPVPFYSKLPRQKIKDAPQILIQNRLFRRRLPAVLLPFCNPAGNTVLNILAVRIELYCLAPETLRIVYGGQGIYGGGKLHAVVRGMLLAAAQLTFLTLGDYDDTPAARTGVAGTTAVGINDNVIVIQLWFTNRTQTLFGSFF